MESFVLVLFIGLLALGIAVFYLRPVNEDWAEIVARAQGRSPDADKQRGAREHAGVWAAAKFVSFFNRSEDKRASEFTAQLEARKLRDPHFEPVLEEDDESKLAMLMRSLKADLAITKRTLDLFATEVVSVAVVAGLGAAGFGFLARLAFKNMPGFTIALLAILGAVGGAAMARSDLKNKAARLRSHFEQALQVFEELASLAMAAGILEEAAFRRVARMSDDWVFREIDAVSQAARAKDPPEPRWKALTALGEEYGVVPLTELGDSLRLAGKGSKIRETISKKASALRRKLTWAEAARNKQKNETMFVSEVLIAVGFLIFIGFALVQHLSLSAVGLGH